MIYDNEMKAEQDPGYIQFRCSIDSTKYDENKACNNITNNISHHEDKYIVWKLKHITTREEPLITYQTNYKWDWCNFMVEWDMGIISQCVYLSLHDMNPYRKYCFVDSVIHPHANMHRCYTKLSFTEIC